VSNDTLTAVPGVSVGHWTHPEAHTGCTVVVLPEPNVVAWEVRGAAPGSRETALLEPGMRVEQAQALVLTGGSAFGLATADGVMRQLEIEGRGHPTPVGPVPIVPAAVVFDLRPGLPRPGADDGAAAYRNAGDGPVEQGLVGAGAGTSVAKWRGFEHARPGGVGSATVVIGPVVVGALVVVNAVGDVFSLEGESLTGGPAVPGPPAPFPPPAGNTTLAVVATNARLSRVELLRVAVRAQDAYAVCLRPAHTRYDGDACFAVSCGQEELSVDLVAEAAFEAVGRAIGLAIASSGGR
jgi:L-aminopeptidase/D-esterase-like protein